jgi:hypothetical protein
MRKTLTTAALLLAFSCPAFAGEMGTPGAPTPPPPPVVQEPTTGGEMQNGATGSLTQIALDILAVLPSLL